MSQISLLASTCILLVLLTKTSQKQAQTLLSSKLNTDKHYADSSFNPKDLYSIDIQRIATNKEDETSKCRSQLKEITTPREFEKFRVGHANARQESVYETLTVLGDRDDGIDGFKILGQHIMMLMMDGTAIFLSNDRDAEVSPAPVDVMLKKNVGENKITPLIAPIKGNAYVSTNTELSFCEPKIKKCTKIEGFKGVSSLVNFFAFEYKAKQYLFFLSGSYLTTYQISSNGIALNQKTFNADFFGRNRVFLEEVIVIPGNKILILDFYTGLMELEHSEDSLADIKKFNGLAYEQYGCRHLSSQKNGEYVVMQCSLTQKTYFVLQLVRETSSGKYGAQQPIFFNQILTGVGASSDMIMANIFSGVKLFWTSTDLESPYPYDYQKAGSIFLHNAKGSQLWTLNDHKVLYIYTEDQLRLYDLQVKTPQIVCFSKVPIKQQYRVTYTYLCEKESLLHLKVCTSQSKINYEAWQHKEVGILNTILPLLVSSLLVLGVGGLLIKLYRKYDNEIETAKLKYNTQEDFAIGDH